jgi:hypothetical protein
MSVQKKRERKIYNFRLINLDLNAFDIIVNVRSYLWSKGFHASYSDTIRFLAKKAGYLIEKDGELIFNTKALEEVGSTSASEQTQQPKA